MAGNSILSAIVCVENNGENSQSTAMNIFTAGTDADAHTSFGISTFKLPATAYTGSLQRYCIRKFYELPKNNRLDRIHRCL